MRASVALPKEQERELGWADALCRGVVHRALSGLRSGELTLIEPSGRITFGSSDFGPSLTVTVESPRAYRVVALGGTIGAGRAYMDGLWTTPDLTALIRMFAADFDSQFDLEGGLATVMRPINAVVHALRRNTRSGSRRNIAEHYDLGNDFYRLFLDDTMAYSCGIFEDGETSLRDASIAKFDRLCRKLRLAPGDHVLEIGTGWGGFAIHAAERYGCRVTTTTISREQYELASARVEEAGLAGRVEVLDRDYRDLEGRFDKLVSVEMLEAVGDQFYDEFFGRASRLLAPDGLLAIQTITIPDQSFSRHRREVDFIKRYIFPGSCIPSLTAIQNAVTRATDIRLVDLHDITRHYATTLSRWREAFWDQVEAVRGLGYDERFIRMWDFYLAYCEGGFAERYLGNVQLLFAKPGFRE